MKKLATIIILLFAICGFAQGEANFWYFGENSGLNFNTNPPTPISGNLSTNEGCASFSDGDGNLLFYTDGKDVWNKNGNYMPNGRNLKGNSSSTQSAIIVPYPDNENQFYIFTVGAYFDDEIPGFNCYLIDMTSNGGLGDINSGPINLSDNKDIEWTEKVTSVKGSECNTFWVISLVNNTYYSYKVDDINGLNPIPVISTVNYQSTDRRGYLKVSPDGKKLASATYTQYYNDDGENIIGNGKLHLYSFDDATGKISNDGIELLSNAALDGSPYGVEFSPQSTKLYCSTFDGFNNKLYQFNLENTAITSSKTLIKSQSGYRGALQLAPNGKIYATVPVNYETGTNYLDAINSPDELGTNCNYQTDALNLGSGVAMQGLPPFIASLLLPIEITSVENNNELITNQTLKLCVGSDYTFNAENLPGNPTYSWIHNTLEINNISSSSLTLTNIQLTEAGIYELVVDLIDDCGFPIIYKGQFEIEVYNPPVILNTFTYIQCDIDEDGTNGITLFNLNAKLSEITNNDPDLEVLFYESQNDFDNDNSISNPSEYESPDNPQLLVKITNTQSGCYTTGFMELNVKAISLNTYDDVYACENDVSALNSNEIKSIGSGTGNFNFEVIRNMIHTIFIDPTIDVEFYKNTNDAQLLVNQISGINEYPTMEIIVKISNKDTKECISVGKFNLIVNLIPVAEGNNEDIILCVNNPRDEQQLFTVLLDGDTGISNDTYQWYKNGNIIFQATNSTYEANAEGFYKIEVTHTYENLISNLNDDSYCVGFTTFNVVESNPPVINQNDIKIVDDSENNSITITTANLGIGNYEFAIKKTDELIGNFQDEPYFENLLSGIYTIYIRDKNNCGIAEIDVSLIGFPKFFTPNNDGVNDTWKVLGVNENFYASSNIYIFNRFGKLITQINPKSEGWDGLFNGEILPATDYWFSVELIDTIGNIRVKKGHFSLIRR